MLLNSKFCDKFVNSNLKFVNWKREHGCVCNEINNPVDWCGCSPNFLNTNDDMDYLRNDLKNIPIFFARKFDPLHNNQLINIVDQSIFGIYSGNFKSLNAYWHNIYDSNEKTQLENKLKFLTDYFRSVAIEIFSKNYKEEPTEKLNFMLKTVHAFFEADIFRGIYAFKLLLIMKKINLFKK